MPLLYGGQGDGSRKPSLIDIGGADNIVGSTLLSAIISIHDNQMMDWLLQHNNN